MKAKRSSQTKPSGEPVFKAAKIQFHYLHQNERYYVRTFAAGKEKGIDCHIAFKKAVERRAHSTP